MSERKKPITHEDLEARRTRQGYWQFFFDNGYFKLDMPMILNPCEIESFDHSLSFLRRQITRWSAAWTVDRAELDGTLGIGEGI